MENSKYFVRVGFRSVELNNIDDAKVVSECVRELHDISTNTGGVFLTKDLVIAFLILATAIDLCILYFLYKLFA